MKKINLKFNNCEKGVALIITFFISIIILAIVVSVSVLLYSELKIVKNIGNSIVSFYAADSGIEKVLYYDWQVKPLVSNGHNCMSNNDCSSYVDHVCVNNLCKAPVSRGLCSMVDPNNPNYCASGDGNNNCKNSTPAPGFFTGTCSPNNCTNCTITFDTMLNNDDGIKYSVKARVYPGADPTKSVLEINSGGSYPSFGGAQRKIQIIINPL